MKRALSYIIMAAAYIAAICLAAAYIADLHTLLVVVWAITIAPMLWIGKKL